MPVIETSLTTLALWAVIGYLFGSVPFGLLLTRALKLGDLRKIGSGNIGATNVLRTGNKRAAALTLILDGGKGAVAVLAGRAIAGEDAAQVAALFAFLGHCYPVWLEFRGGKGVATFLGILLALAWPVGIAACLTWLATAVIARISSLSALVAAGSSTIWMLVLGHGTAFFLGIALTLLIFWRHRANISRLRTGTEPRIGQN
ncbi:glycerol-3-phosphate 1-O-acyltransferase PlsY [Aquicoccus porphyridii]|uniref:Glycerol-3-phosphate acyltransferase n=1 Tax=Aquicoccus porphyridii TaxID=1852029 RepID=A0A5A9Z4V8_9RHOB|nr:glycerol-3-phosphate 1-O-acyltransferase PlsY [Aquicoccus porphyridii]KAA0912217.1 glycerol-3-phosphate 1-O-acyltransferase PlsY [Aquicoccus porphyridii]RAI52932.1 acyl-phosphate glycerol 3-phosphate acyltransferase [Rhodobacteraceae bacterium AsT-22]